MKLGVNIDHIATLRQARLSSEPSLLRAALLAEISGADGITAHLREDRRHIQDKDVYDLKNALNIRLNLEISASDEIVEIATKVNPDMATLVPEKRQELTTEGGLDIVSKTNFEKLKNAVKKLQDNNIIVSLFIDPEPNIMKNAAIIGAEFVEIHTGKYADANNEEEQNKELENIKKAVKSAKSEGLRVNAGHGIDYYNVQEIAKIEDIEELNIGHSIISRSVFTGLDNSIKEMKELMENARRF